MKEYYVTKKFIELDKKKIVNMINEDYLQEQVKQIVDETETIKRKVIDSF